MLPHAGSLELRLADLEGHLDRLNSTLRQWERTPASPHPVEQHLAFFSERCSDIVKQWAATSERHAHAVRELEAKLNDWNDVAAKLQRDATWRFQDLERLIEHEWASLRRLHEEPVRQLRDQAESLTEICVSTAGSTQTGIERAEARLAVLEKDLHRRMDDLSRDVHAVLDELRQHNSGATLRSPASSWALDEVTRLHHEIRDGASTGKVRVEEEVIPDVPTSSLALRAASGATQSAGEVRRAKSADASTPDVGSQPTVESIEPGIHGRAERKWIGTAATVALVMAIAGGVSLLFYNRARVAAEQATAARQRAETMATAANERIEAARRDAAAQIDLARSTAARAQITSDVLAAPDLVRFNLIGPDPAARTSAQLLLSRSRGLVFSGSRLLPPGGGNVYQIWLLTATDPVSAGTITPDDSGRATFATDRLPDVPRPVLGVRVTVEPAPGREAPSDQTALFRAQ
ncbi:MAG TPA: anti-sigma factor [Vicinamibacterales bacterium]|nr:anti-sigma factor [Vicinamibacterales bacterium]